MESLLRKAFVSSQIYFINALKIFFEAIWQAEMADCLEAMALCAIHGEQFEIAVRLHGTAISCRGWRVGKLGISRIIKKKVENSLQGVQEILGKHRYQELLQEGWAVPVENIVEYVQKVLEE